MVALLGVGIWLVYQERKLATQEAQEFLQQAANRAMKRLDYHVQNDHSLNPEAVIHIHPQQSEEQMHLLTSTTGECLLPQWPMEDVLPDPSPLPWGELDEFETLLWHQAHHEIDPRVAFDQVETFLKQKPSEPFHSLMIFRKLVLMVRLGRHTEASEEIGSFRDVLVGDPHTQSGMPLRVALDFLELQLLKPLLEKVPPDIPREAFGLGYLLPIISRHRLHPNPWTTRFVQYLKELKGVQGVHSYGHSISENLENTAKVRTFYQSFPKRKWEEWGNANLFQSRWVEFDDASFLLIRSKKLQENILFLLTKRTSIERSVGRWLRESLAATGDASQFQLTANIAGKDMLTLPPEDGSWFDPAEQRRNLGPMEIIVDSEKCPFLSLRCVFNDSASFFSKSRQRTRSMLLLIGLAGITGLVGWFGQWKAFRRQVELGRMKSNFVASVSHELRAPIASIRLMSENLSQQKRHTNAERQDYFQWIGLECRRLSALVQNILQFSRLELGKRDYMFEAVEIGRLFQETLKLMEPLAASVQVKLESETKQVDGGDLDALPDAMWDGQAIHQALVNLIDNAIKHTPKEGVVRIELRLEEKAGCVEFLVIDQGPGIETSDRKRIFRPFERLGSEMTRKTKGVGIGLNLVWHTTRAHRGTVRVEEAPEGGSCFILSLPLQAKQP